MEDAVNGSAAGSSGPIVIAGAGYAGLHVALRLTARLRNRPEIELTLVDRHDWLWHKDREAVTLRTVIR
jgi:NADH dehydrogenase FAD-containing subunit